MYCTVYCTVLYIFASRNCLVLFGPVLHCPCCGNVLLLHGLVAAGRLNERHAQVGATALNPTATALQHTTEPTVLSCTVGRPLNGFTLHCMYCTVLYLLYFTVLYCTVIRVYCDTVLSCTGLSCKRRSTQRRQSRHKHTINARPNASNECTTILYCPVRSAC